MALISLESVSKTFGDRELLQRVSMVVREGERIGLVGANGAGKTTLLKILAGIEEFEEGACKPRKDLRLGYLPQTPPMQNDQRARDVAREGLTGADESTEFVVEAMLDRVGITEPDKLCGNMSGGEQRRVAVARALLGDPELLLLDEPTNHLDAFVTDWLEQFLLSAGVPLVMVTHDRYFLDRVATRILELEQGSLFKYPGGYAEFLRLRGDRLDSARKSERTRRNLLRRESEWMRRGPQGRGTKAKARQGAFDVLATGRRDIPEPDLELVLPSGPHLGTKVIKTHRLKRSPVFECLDLEFIRGECVGIVGPNGAGKTTLLELIAGRLEPQAGRVEMGETVRLAYLDQQRRQLDPKRTVAQEIADEATTVRIGERTVRVESFLKTFLFSPTMFRTEVAKLSGGERNRVLLGKLLVQAGNVLLLDEPTNDLDLMTLRALEEALLGFPGTVLVVSHDRFFLDRVADRILYLDGSGRVRDHAGGITSLLAELRALRRPKRDAPKPGGTPVKNAKHTAKSKGPRRLSYNEKRELEALPDQIAGVEAELSQIDSDLAKPQVYTGDGAEVARLTARRAELTTSLATMYERWEALESIHSGS